ncbi:tyrosine-type recombinase/integrase [Pseudomonas sp. RT6P73]
MGLHHAAMPLESRISRRLPITTEQIKRLRLAAFSDQTASAFVKERRRVMIRTLEMTGGRRLELKHLTLASVAHAGKTGHLRMLVVKQAGKTPRADAPEHNDRLTYREIPISDRDTQLLTDYVHVHRAPLMAKHLTTQLDHGYLFVSETSGRPLCANTITFEIQKLRTLAQIAEPVSPHLFRHRFITKIFVAQIMRSKIETLSDFREALMNTQTLKRKVQELTGHKNLASLDIYIHLAWDEAQQLHETSPSIEKLQSLSAITEQLTHLISELDQSDLSKNTRTLLDLITSFEALL